MVVHFGLRLATLRILLVLRQVAQKFPLTVFIVFISARPCGLPETYVADGKDSLQTSHDIVQVELADVDEIELPSASARVDFKLP